MKQIRDYVTYNLALAWLHTGQPEAGIKLLDSLGRKNFSTEELLALKDRANLSLGLFYLKEKNYPVSRRYLDRIRLHGPHATKGLLASGWVDVKMKAFRPALIPWKELRQRDLLDPFVQEAILVVPYALAESGLNKPSADAYEEALKLFTAEQQRLRSSIDNLHSGDFIDDLVETGESVEMGWMRSLETELHAPEPTYLYRLLSSHRTQESLKNYRDLLFLKKNILEWLSSMDAFDDMVSLRKSRFQSVLPEVDKMKQDDRIATLVSQYTAISDQFIAAKTQSRLLAFADRDELEKFDRLNRLRNKIKARPDMPAAAYLNQRLSFLAGILFWDIYSTLPKRVAEEDGKLLDIKNEIRLSKNFISHINRLIKELPMGFDSYTDKITIKSQQLQTTLDKLNGVIEAQKKQLVAVVEEELNGHYQRLENLRIQTIFALAQIYDRGTSVDTPPAGERKSTVGEGS